MTQGYKSFMQLVNEAVDKMDDDNLYLKFQTNMSFRYKAVSILSDNGFLVHGTNTDFDSFDSSKIKGGMRGNYGYGAYFTNEAYKCEEYGRNFVFLDAKDFNFLDLHQKVKANDVLSDYRNKIDELEIKITEFEAKLYNVRNNREYDYYNTELDKSKEELKRLVPDVKTSVFIERYYKILNENENIDYHNMTKELSNVFDYHFGNTFVTDFFLKLGFDGYHIYNEYIIFNFEKLNNNIVKDKNALLERLINNKQ